MQHTKSISKRARGFSIIEVVLVLAIAGLIFLMVFIALPALQSSQRDTQRRSAVGTIVSGVESYNSGNRGIMIAPTATGKWEPTTSQQYKYLSNGEQDYTVLGIVALTANAAVTNGSNGGNAGATFGKSGSSYVVDTTHAIVFTNAKCGTIGTIVSDSTTARQFAVVGGLESGGGSVYCQNN